LLHSRPRRGREETNPFLLSGIEPRFLGNPTRRLLALPTLLYRLQMNGALCVIYIEIINFNCVWLVEHVTRTIEVSHAYSCLVRIVEIRRALERLNRRWEDNIELNVKLV